MNNMSGGIRVSAILTVVIVVLLLAVGFGVYSQKNALKQGAVESADAKEPAFRHHKIPPAPQPVVQAEDTEEAFDKTVPEDQTVAAESETQTDALNQAASSDDMPPAIASLEKIDPEPADIEFREAVPSSEDVVEEDALSVAQQPAEDDAGKTINTDEPVTVQAEQTEPPAPVKPSAADLSETNTSSQDAGVPSVSDAADIADDLKETVPESEPEMVDNQVVSEPFYTIQVGAFRSLVNAEQSVARMQKDGFDAYVFESGGASSQPWYLVRFGRFDQQAPAREQLEAYNRTHKSQALLKRSDRF